MDKIKITLLCMLIGGVGFAQEVDKEKIKALQASKNLTSEANKQLTENDFINAEADYRRAISKSSENTSAPYNLGNAYYNRESYKEAFTRYKQAGELTSDKSDKHKAYHNMGNVFMKNKEYEKAVEAYKEALRNNPKDEETRYNLALAKEMLKKKQDEQKNDQNKDKEDQKDKKDQKKDQKNQGDQGDQDKDKKGDQDKNKDKGDEKKEENKEGDGDKKEEKKQQPRDGDKPKEQKRPRPNQLSPQQIKNLLEAMQNEEKKVQKKIDAKKVKGVKIKNEKDW